MKQLNNNINLYLDEDSEEVGIELKHHNEDGVFNLSPTDWRDLLDLLKWVEYYGWRSWFEK